MKVWILGASRTPIGRFLGDFSNIPAPMPNDGDIADTVFTWLPTETLRQQILVRNPEVLYGFAPFSGARA